MTAVAAAHVYLSVPLRYRPIWAVAAHLRPFRPLHTPDGFCPLFAKLDAITDRAFGENTISCDLVDNRCLIVDNLASADRPRVIVR
jgi:hypothetical protein